jgi:hypothetical protein
MDSARSRVGDHRIPRTRQAHFRSARGSETKLTGRLERSLVALPQQQTTPPDMTWANKHSETFRNVQIRLRGQLLQGMQGLSVEDRVQGAPKIAAMELSQCARRLLRDTGSDAGQKYRRGCERAIDCAMAKHLCGRPWLSRSPPTRTRRIGGMNRRRV